MASLRIVHALPFYHPATQFGGPVAQLKLVCAELARRGHQVRVVTTDNGVGWDWPRDQWVPVDGYEVWYGRTGWINRRPPFYGPMLRAPLIEALSGSDVLHLHVAFTLVNELGRQVAGKLGIPYVYASRGCLAPHRLRSRWLSKKLFLGLFERRVIREAAALHAVADREVAHLVKQRADPAQVVMIPNGVDCEIQDHAADVNAWRERLGIAADAPVVLFLGQLIAIKGLDLLIETVGKVKQHLPNVQLIIAGADGGDEVAARARVASNGLEQSCHFIGHVDGQRKLEAFACADVFALTSRDEGLPNAVIEACAMSLPVLITTGCNLPEVAQYEAGLVVEPKVDRLAVGLERMLTDTELRRSMGQKALQMVRDKFSIAHTVTCLEELYGRVAANAKQ